MIFKPMALEEAKEFYNRMKTSPCAISKIGMEDIWFFTDGLTKDYGNASRTEREAENEERKAE